MKKLNNASNIDLCSEQNPFNGYAGRLPEGLDYSDDKPKEECGVFGIYDRDGLDVSRAIYYGLYALQHRGQESAGIAVNDHGTMVYHKDMGLVNEIFNPVVLDHLKGQSGIGHVRYSTTGASFRENAQPIVIKYKRGQMALAHNGNLVNAGEIRDRLEESGTIFQTTNDTEVLANLISRNRLTSDSIESSILKVMDEVKGSYALVILTPRKLVGVRDPFGIRPLCIGKIDNTYILSSESCGIESVGGQFVRDVLPGEIVIIEEGNLRSIQAPVPKESKLCVFEYIYFARTDSIIDGASVHHARMEAGRRLAKESPVEADLVIGVPDSGISAAIGYSRESGIPFGSGLIKNRYVGRTFIQPDQGQREIGVRIKLSAVRSEVEGKRVIMIDDSIVRGTTSRRIVQTLKDAGAKEVHMRISSPPITYPCFFGIDTPSRKNLVAATSTIEEIRELVGADSLAYLSVDGLLDTPKGCKCGFCTACFTGDYPMKVPSDKVKDSLG